MTEEDNGVRPTLALVSAKVDTLAVTLAGIAATQAATKELFTILREGDKEERKLLRAEMEHRLEGLDDFSRRMERLEGTFVTNAVLATYMETTAAAFQVLNNWKSNMEGRLVMIASIPTVASFIATVIAIWSSIK